MPAWNAAFVLDSEAGATATLEILEFANSQLLEFRYHDDLLESEIARTYALLQRPRSFSWLVGRRYTRRRPARCSRSSLDVNELTDRIENAVKIVGDIYSARLLGLAAARLGVDSWKKAVEEKLKTLGEINQFAVDQTGMSQANLLELVIVLILVLELGLFFAGIMK